jgi:hypothetical protein
MENQGGELRRFRRRYSVEEKRRIIGLYEESGLSRSEFCRREGIGLINLQRWIGKKRRRELAGGERGVRFVEVEAAGIAAGGPRPYRVGFGEGVWLELESGFDEREVRILAGILRERGQC